MMNDATCRFGIPVLGRRPTDPMEVILSDDIEDRERRCSLTRTTMEEERLAIGQAATDMWRMRIVCHDIEPQVGWVVDILKDGEKNWHKYHVTRTQKRLFWDLMLRRVVDSG